MSSESVARLATAIPAIRYVKEETLPNTHHISELLRLVGGTIDGVFGGSGGRFLVEELRRGACGLMSGCHLVDAQVRVFDMWKTGREAEARAALLRQQPAQLLWSLLGLEVPKEVLRRRGIFRTTLCRQPAGALDRADHEELDYALNLLRSDLVRN